MSAKRITVRVRQDDLLCAIHACSEWHLSLADAARGSGYDKPDQDTMRSARQGLAAVARLRAAYRLASEASR